MKKNLEFQKIVNNIRELSIDMIDNAKSGHPGIALGAAPIMFSLFMNHMKIDVKNPRWLNRDRFILSAGHGSALLYATLHLSGFDLAIEDLKKFRSIDSLTPGHPELNLNFGVEVTTGPLGQGFANAVGVAISEKFLANKLGNNIIDYYTYVLCSDGDLMEGVSNEAASLAGTMGLEKLIVLYDSNKVCLDGNTSSCFQEKVIDRFKSLGWDTHIVRDANNITAIDKAIKKSKKCKNKPSIIEIKSIIGYGSKNQGTSKVHGSPLEKEDFEQLKKKLGNRTIPFAVSKDVVSVFQNNIQSRNHQLIDNWNSVFAKMDEKQRKIIDVLNNNVIEIDFSSFDLSKLKEQMATRDTNAIIMNYINKHYPLLIGGSADLASSTKAYIENGGTFSSKNPSGQNIAFGVREHAMGAIINGIALNNIRTFGSTFLTFSDYMKPAIRLAAIMKLPVTYIFTHDSILIGQDGPTHQPIEHLSMLRSIPNLNVYRPADGIENIGAWDSILQNHETSAIALSRTSLEPLDGTDAKLVSKGAYIVYKEQATLHGIIIATGSEVATAIKVSKRLWKSGLDLRVVSMPCMSKFLEQNEEYKQSILPKGFKTIVIELGSSFGWHQFVYNQKYLITLDSFGASGIASDIINKYGFDEESLIKKVWEIFK